MQLNAYIARSIATVVVALLGVGIMYWGSKSRDVSLHSGGLLVLVAGSMLWVGDLLWSLPDDYAGIILNYRFAVGVVVVALWTLSYRITGLRVDSWNLKLWQRSCGIAVGLLVFALISMEVSEPFRIAGEENAKQLALSSAWILYGAVIMWLGLCTSLCVLAHQRHVTHGPHHPQGFPVRPRLPRATVPHHLLHRPRRDPSDRLVRLHEVQGCDHWGGEE